MSDDGPHRFFSNRLPPKERIVLSLHPGRKLTIATDKAQAGRQIVEEYDSEGF